VDRTYVRCTGFTFLQLKICLATPLVGKMLEPKTIFLNAEKHQSKSFYISSKQQYLRVSSDSQLMLLK
jgi:hypothetical protein